MPWLVGGLVSAVAGFSRDVTPTALVVVGRIGQNARSTEPNGWTRPICRRRVMHESETRVGYDDVPPADPIRLEEWTTLVENASDLSWDRDAEGTDAVLVSDPVGPVLRLEDGMVVVKSPPEAILLRLVELAEQVDGVVVGDDAVVYRRQPDGGLIGADPLDRHHAGQPPEWWRRLDASPRAPPRAMPAGAPDPVVGERYLDLITRQPCTVREIDSEGERGRGLVRVMFDDNGEAWRLRCDGDLGTLDVAADTKRSRWRRLWRRGR